MIEEVVKGSSFEPFLTKPETLAGAIGIANPAILEIAVANIKHLETESTKQLSDFGVFGIIVLMNAKFRQLEALMSKRRRKAQDEQVHKALRDISNYALVAQLVEGGKWPTDRNT